MILQRVRSPQKARLRLGQLWILAALLGAATLWSSISIIHGGGDSHAAAQAATDALARNISDRAEERLRAASDAIFAPALGLEALEQAAALAAMERAQRAAVGCGCRAVFPISAFFALDSRSGSLLVRSVGAGSVDRSEVEAVATRAARRWSTNARVRTSLVPSASDQRIGILTFVPVAVGATGTVYGAVVELHDLLRAVVTRGPADSADRSSTLVSDTMAVTVSTASGQRIFGAIGGDRGVRAAVAGRGALDGFVLTVAPTTRRIIVRSSTSTSALWQNGALGLLTIMVIVIAVISSRRELLLARARSDFIAGVSHDLRMPLAQVLLAGETLSMQRERDAAERVTLADSIVRETRRLIALVENVLLFSRSGAVSLSKRSDSVSVAEVLDDAAEAVRLAADDAGQRIEIGTVDTPAVIGDRRLLVQAIINLLDNALKYGPRGQVIRLAAARAAQAMVRITVDDHGPGVPARERERVFDAYERLGADQASERTGSGLGLAVVRQIVRACNGRVWLEESSSGGTRAVIELRQTTGTA